MPTGSCLFATSPRRQELCAFRPLRTKRRLFALKLLSAAEGPSATLIFVTRHFSAHTRRANVPWNRHPTAHDVAGAPKRVREGGRSQHVTSRNCRPEQGRHPESEQREPKDLDRRNGRQPNRVTRAESYSQHVTNRNCRNPLHTNNMKIPTRNKNRRMQSFTLISRPAPPRFSCLISPPDAPTIAGLQMQSDCRKTEHFSPSAPCWAFLFAAPAPACRRQVSPANLRFNVTNRRRDD